MASTTTTHVLATTAVLAAGALAAGAVFAWSGIYDFAADDPHTAPVLALLTTMREHSIERRAGDVRPPPLDDTAQVVQGAGNYEAMCIGCHLAPGMKDSELSRGLYPSPPNLSQHKVEPAHAFWVIKHGIKASGMPAWGKSMGDEDVWNLTAFLQRLPQLDASAYEAMVAQSGGHSHGGGDAHEHGESHHHGAAPDHAEPHAHADVHGEPADGKHGHEAPSAATPLNKTTPDGAGHQPAAPSTAR